MSNENHAEIDSLKSNFRPEINLRKLINTIYYFAIPVTERSAVFSIQEINEIEDKLLMNCTSLLSTYLSDILSENQGKLAKISIVEGLPCLSVDLNELHQEFCDALAHRKGVVKDGMLNLSGQYPYRALDSLMNHIFSNLNNNVMKDHFWREYITDYEKLIAILAIKDGLQLAVMLERLPLDKRWGLIYMLGDKLKYIIRNGNQLVIILERLPQEKRWELLNVLHSKLKYLIQSNKQLASICALVPGKEEALLLLVPHIVISNIQTESNPQNNKLRELKPAQDLLNGANLIDPRGELTAREMVMRILHSYCYPKSFFKYLTTTIPCRRELIEIMDKLKKDKGYKTLAQCVDMIKTNLEGKDINLAQGPLTRILDVLEKAKDLSLSIERPRMSRKAG